MDGNTPAEWLLLSIYAPGREPVPGGILLVDHGTGKLHVRVCRRIPDADDDINDVLDALADDLDALADRSDADRLLAQWEDQWSHTLRLGRRHAIRVQDPAKAADRLFYRCIANQDPQSVPIFNKGQVAAAGNSLSASPGVALQLLMALRNPESDFSFVEETAGRDAVISAHLVRLANSALYGSHRHVRSVREALSRIGTQDASLHIAALTTRRVYSGAHRALWNHSLDVAQITRRVATRVPEVRELEVMLVAWVHDIGRLVLLSIPGFEKELSALQSQGDYVTEAERQLCSQDHAEVGADLLAAWNFPADMVAAVRGHHASGSDAGILGDVLYLAEHLSGSEEDLPRRDIEAIASRLHFDLHLVGHSVPEPRLERVRFATNVG
jgi:HD-like signal output (HDOD) protein